VTVPGELRGLEAIHSRHGKLPWSELFAPAVALARDGFEINQDLYRAMTTTIPGTKIPTDFVPYDEEPETSFASKPKSFLIEDPAYAPIFSSNGKLLPPLSITTRPTYADTLETIAREGPGAFYSGKLANQTVDSIKSKGGLMTLEDLEGSSRLESRSLPSSSSHLPTLTCFCCFYVAYSVHIRPAVSLKYRNHTVRSCQAPSSGSIVLSILNTMSGYEVDHSDVNNHRIVEADKVSILVQVPSRWRTSTRRRRADIISLSLPSLLDRSSATDSESTSEILSSFTTSPLFRRSSTILRRERRFGRGSTTRRRGIQSGTTLISEASPLKHLVKLAEC